MKNNKITNEKEQEIVFDINKGMPFKQLKEKYGFTYKVFLRVAFLFGIQNKFLENNKNNRIISTKNRIKNEKERRYSSFDSLKGQEIEDKIKEGFHVIKLMTLFDLSQSFLQNFVKWKSKELWVILVQNSKIVLENNRIVASKKGADKTRGSIKRHVTMEEKQICFSLFQEGKHITEIQRKTKIPIRHLRKVFVELNVYPEPFSFNGENNNMYGKTPSEKAGIGTKCWILIKDKKIFCRSSLELKIFLTLQNKGIEFCLSKERIEFTDKNGKQKTYNPDFEYENFVCEIKPKIFLNHGENPVKFKAAELKMNKLKKQFKIITEDTFDLTWITKHVILNKIEENSIIIDENNKEKLWRNL